MYQIIEVIGMPKRLYHKIWLIMRLTTVILIACLMQVSAAGLAQKITLNQRDVPLSNVLKEIRKQSGFDVFSEGKGLPKNQKVTVVVTNASIEEALDQAFKGLGYTYKIDGKTIAIIPKEEGSFFDRMIDRFQAIDVSGKIVDENGQPIAGATIKVKGTTISTASDGNGVFLLKNISDDALLQISYLGYQVKEVRASKDIGSIKMELAIGKLEEVTINAGYYTVKQQELTGSISRITSKDIENQPVTSVLATMQGRMAGVAITQNTGVPGGGFDIKIRGQNSLRFAANNPLFVIDGVPYSSDNISTGTNAAVLATGLSPLNSIDPNQIESLEVLKDADATAIYGSRGANGVVLITTKRGKAGKTQFSSKVTTGVSNVTRFMKLMNTEQYLEMRREAFKNDGITSIPSTAYDVNGTWDQSRYTDWQKELLGGNARATNAQASLSGGSQQTQFMFSGNFNKQTSVFPFDYKYYKGNFNLNVNHESIDRKFKSLIVVGYSMQNNNQPKVDFMREVFTLAPNAPKLYNEDGTLNWENGTFNNPLRNLVGQYTALTNDLIGNVTLSYQLLKNLEIKSNFGLTSIKTNDKAIEPSTIFWPGGSSAGPENSSLILGSFERKSWAAEPQINWSQQFENSSLSALVGGTFQSQNSNNISQYGYGFSSNALIENIASATSIFLLNTNELEYRYQGFFARINYNLKEKYILNLTGRRDGSSRFGPNRKFATFGAIGMAWLFSKENIFQNNKILSFGKLRGSYGSTGSDQLGDYQYLDTYTAASVRYGSVVGLRPNRLFNPEFGWETNKKLEVALELGFFENQLTFDASYYNNRSSNQLTGIPMPGLTGFTSLQANLPATVQNSGLELTLNSINLKGKDWSWNSSLNLTFSRTKLVEYPNLASSTYANTYAIGQPLSIKKVYEYINVDPQTGRYTFTDVNGDGLLTTAEDRKSIVDLSPKYFGGLQNSISFKNWRLDFLFQFVKQTNYNASSYFALAGTQGNQPLAALNRWQKTGDQATYQAFTNGTNSQARAAYSNYFESTGAFGDASYIRLKNISLIYALPFKKLKCNLVFEGQNILTFTNYDGADPEFSAIGSLPPLKTFTTGFQFNF